MNFLIAVLLLPSVFWNQGPETANQLKSVGITHISVPASVADSWKSVPGMSVVVEEPAQLTKVPAPSVSYRYRVASATRAPWVNCNGSKFLRNPSGHFFYNAPGTAAPVAAAEAFMYNVHATIQTDAGGLAPLGKMLSFLEKIDGSDLSPLVNIGFLDDGTPESGEFMNLLVRRNLLFKVVKQPDPKLDLTVSLGTAQYPRSEASNPSLLAEKVRANLTDQKRLLRVYGSEVVVGRLLGNGSTARLYLLNYGAARRPVNGIRLRVRGVYHQQKATQYDATATLQDATTDATGTEFTLPELKTFAIIDLAR